MQRDRRILGSDRLRTGAGAISAGLLLAGWLSTAGCASRQTGERAWLREDERSHSEASVQRHLVRDETIGDRERREVERRADQEQFGHPAR